MPRFASQTTSNICAVFCEDVVTKYAVYRWFKWFEHEDPFLEGAPRSGRPWWMTAHCGLKETPNVTTRESSAILECHHPFVAYRLHALGYRQMVSTSAPHDLGTATERLHFSAFVMKHSRKRSHGR